jgi:hypothetical protein
MSKSKLAVVALAALGIAPVSAQAGDASGFAGFNVSVGASASSTEYTGERSGSGNYTGTVGDYTDPTGTNNSPIAVDEDYSYGERFKLPISLPSAGFSTTVGYNYVVPSTPVVLGVYGKYHFGDFSGGSETYSSTSNFPNPGSQSWDDSTSGGGGSSATVGQDYSFDPTITPAFGVAQQSNAELQHLFSGGLKLGVAVIDSTMIFATAGYGIGEADTFIGNQTVHGITFGGGFETNLGGGWFLGASAERALLKTSGRDDVTTFDEGFSSSQTGVSDLPTYTRATRNSDHHFSSSFEVYSATMSLGFRF